MKIKSIEAEQVDIECLFLILAKNNEQFLHGQCHLFALALKEASGLPIAAILDFDPNLNKVCLAHAFVRPHDDYIIDLKGYREEFSLQKEFDMFEPESVSITELNLLKLGEGRAIKSKRVKFEIAAALPLARIVFKLASRQIELEILLDQAYRQADNVKPQISCAV